VPEENFWTLWCKGRFTEADTLTIWLGATPSGLTSAHLHHPPHIFLRAGCPSCHPTNSVKALKAIQFESECLKVSRPDNEVQRMKRFRNTAANGRKLILKSTRITVVTAND